MTGLLIGVAIGAHYLHRLNYGKSSLSPFARLYTTVNVYRV